MAGVASFLKKYWPSIISIVVVTLTCLIVFQMTGVNFSPYDNKRIEKVVTIEGFDAKPDHEALGKAHEGDTASLHGACNKMSKKACGMASYCVLLDGEQCVGGSRKGPTYLTKDGKDLDYKFYMNKGKCYGACPKKEEGA
jgi:hypothetical protein